MENSEKRVILNGIDIPFMDLVVLLVKLAFAWIPAMVVIFVMFGLLSILFDGVFNMFLFKV